MKWMNVEETLRGAETPLFWVGAFTVASLALWLVYRLLSGFRIWVLGNGKLLSPKLGKWAGELGSHQRQRVRVSKWGYWAQTLHLFYPHCGCWLCNARRSSSC